VESCCILYLVTLYGQMFWREIKKNWHKCNMNSMWLWCSKAGLSHNNVSAETVFVSESGVWKLGSFESARQFDQLSMEFLHTCRLFTSANKQVCLWHACIVCLFSSLKAPVLLDGMHKHYLVPFAVCFFNLWTLIYIYAWFSSCTVL